MKNEDLNFLQELQEKLNRADNDPEMHDHQAAPRYWVVMEKKLVVSDNGEPYVITECGQIALPDFIEEVEEDLEDCPVDIQRDWALVDKDDAEEVSDFVNEKLGRVTYSALMEEEDSVAWNTLFISKAECQRHIKCNGYHYRKPRTFAMTAWRSPEFERFIRLFQELNLSEIKTEEDKI